VRFQKAYANSSIIRVVSTTYQSGPVDPHPSQKQDFSTKVNHFWRRVTDGLELNQLWSQFQADARSSYRLYSHDVVTSRPEGVRQGKHWFEVAKQFFWAILEKLSPARRVLLLLALIMVVFNPALTWQDKEGTHLISFDLRLYGGLILFILLVLEVADRVVMKRDLQIAREIQMWLLPTNAPPVPGLEIAFATRPANTVAGDYYDVFARPASSGDGQAAYVLSVADVAGKSIPAALLMATFQASLKTLAATPVSLAELVASMNHYACSNSQGGLRFTTAFLGEYRPETRCLTYINAGHNTPILRRKAGTIERLETGGLPLGILAATAYQSATVTLEPGDWLVIFTDGVVEAVNAHDEEYGETRLISVLQAGTEIAPVKLLSRIMVDLDLFAGNTPQHDDMTCVLVKVS
jgi:sigma-B regulation protein RsbU (phosphoserine phosphatase)